MTDDRAKETYKALRSLYMDLRLDQSKQKEAFEVQDAFINLGNTIDWTGEEQEDMANGYQ